MKTIILFCLMSVSLSAFSQKMMDSRYVPIMTHGIGGSFQQFDGINDRIGAFPQYEPLKDYAATLRLGWLREMKRVVSALDFTAGSSMSGHRDEKSSTIRFLSVSTDIGYDLVKSERIMLYPMVGLGLEKYQAKFFKDNTGVNFNDVAGSPAVQNAIRPVSFKNGFFNYRLGAGVQFSSAKYPAHSIGLQAGYTGSFKKTAWKSSDEQDLANAPEDRLSRFYVSLLFGFRPKMKPPM